MLQEAYWPARFPCSAIELGRDRVCGRGRVRDRLARNETRGANRGNERKCVSHPACGCLRDEDQTQEGRDPQGTDPHRGRPHRGRPEGATHTGTRGATHTGDRERPTQGQRARPTQETHRHLPPPSPSALPHLRRLRRHRRRLRLYLRRHPRRYVSAAAAASLAGLRVRVNLNPEPKQTV